MAENPLTRREQEILTLVARGATNKEIAHRLRISEQTVKVHLRNIFQKLDAASRTEAVTRALGQGWLTLPGGGERGEAEGGSPPRPPEGEVREAGPRPRRLGRFEAAVLGALTLLSLAVLGLWWRQARPNPAPSPTPAPAFVASASWAALPPLPEPRADGALIAFGGRLWWFGGRGPGGAAAEAWTHDPKEGTWQALSPLPEPRERPAAAVLGTQVYVAGGIDAGGRVRAEVWSFDLEEGTWRALPPLPEPRADGGLAALEGRLYYAGGRDDGGRPRSEIWAYDPQAGDWQAVGTLPEPRSGLGLVAFEGRLYVLGGEGPDGPAATVHSWRPGDGPWQENRPLPEPRAGAAVARVANYALLIGGAGGDLDQGIRYDLRTGLWQTFPLPEALPRQGVGAAGSEAELYLVGGEGEEGIAAGGFAYRVLFTLFLPATSP